MYVYHEVPVLAGSEKREQRGLFSPLNPFLSYTRWFLRNGRRKQNGVPSVFRRWVAWEVTPRLVTLSPTHLLFLPPLAQPRPFQTPSLFSTSCLHSLWPSYLSRKLQRGETSSPPTLQLLRGSSSETGHAQRGASSLQALGGAAQRRAGTGVPIQPRLQHPPPPSPGFRAAPWGETCTLQGFILNLQPPEPPGLRNSLHWGTVFPPVLSLQLRVF